MTIVCTANLASFLIFLISSTKISALERPSIESQQQQQVLQFPFMITDSPQQPHQSWHCHPVRIFYEISHHHVEGKFREISRSYELRTQEQ